MKKRSLLCGLLCFTATALFSQHLEVQSTPGLNMETLFEKITKLEKKTEMFNVYLNMQGSFNIYFNSDKVNQTSFRMDQLRLEVKGNITDRIYYRYRQRLNQSNAPESLDNLPGSIDYAAVGYHFSNKVSVFAGKQSMAFGGFEFDLNPIEVYQYCEFMENLVSFLTGVDLSYRITPQQEFRFQLVNSRSGSFRNMYGEVPAFIKQPKAPLGYTLNWNGNFANNQIKTRWSASIFHQAEKKNWYYYALGTEVSLSRFLGFFDFMYSNENIDQTGIISGITASDGYKERALNTRYIAMILHLNYRVVPKLNLFVKGMYETSSVLKSTHLLERGKYRTYWGYLAGLEYYPMVHNLHLFLSYIGQTYRYTNRAKIFGTDNGNPQRVEFGFVYQLPLF